MKKLLPIVILFLLIGCASFSSSTDVFFSPKGGCCTAIVKEIDNASSQIAVCVYYFTSDELADALIKAEQRGVTVVIVLDKNQTSTRYSQLDKLQKNSIKPRIDSTHAIMHNKYCIIDKEVVITGSYNWTSAAEEKNAENLLVIRNKKLAAIYLADFEKHWQHSEE